MSDSVTVSSLCAQFGLAEEHLDKEISDHHLDEIAQTRCTYWKSLPPHLGLQHVVVKDIGNEHQKEFDKKREFFRQWKQEKGSEATYRSLVRALLEMKRRSDAEYIVCKLSHQMVATFVTKIQGSGQGACMMSSAAVMDSDLVGAVSMESSQSMRYDSRFGQRAHNGEGSGNITTNLSEAEALSMMEDDIKKLVKGVKNPKGHYEEFSLIVHRNECDDRSCDDGISTMAGSGETGSITELHKQPTTTTTTLATVCSETVTVTGSIKELHKQPTTAGTTLATVRSETVTQSFDSSEVKTSRKQTTSEQERIHSLEMKMEVIHSLEMKMEVMEDKIEQKSKEIDCLKRAREVDATKIWELTAKIDQLESEIDVLEREKQQAERDKETLRFKLEHKDEIDRLKREKAEAENEARITQIQMQAQMDVTRIQLQAQLDRKDAEIVQVKQKAEMDVQKAELDTLKFQLAKDDAQTMQLDRLSHEVRRLVISSEVSGASNSVASPDKVMPSACGSDIKDLALLSMIRMNFKRTTCSSSNSEPGGASEEEERKG